MNNQNPIEIYQAQDGTTQVEVRFENDTVWLSLQQMADLFGRDKSVISRHLRNIYTDGELNREATVAKNLLKITAFNIRKRHKLSLPFI